MRGWAKVNCLFGVGFVFVSTGLGAELRVGAGESYATIQSGIDAAVDGDVVIVADGTYRGDGNRDIDYSGKAITLRSENGPANCVIDCQGSYPEPHRGFFFHSGEDNDSVVEGFTIIGGSNLGGAGIFGRDCSPVIKNCIIRNNACLKSSGGGINITGSDALIIDCVFYDNAAERGAAIACGRGVKIINCLIFNNWASSGGGGIYCMSEDTEIINCTIVKNTATFFGGGVYCGWDADVQAANCIIRGNKSPYRDRVKGLDIALSRDAHLTVRYCNVKGGHALTEPPEKVSWEEGNIDAAPKFVSWNNYHLLADSPCIDKGDNFPVTVDTDLDGNHRITDGDRDRLAVVDMGVFEYINPITAPVADAGENIMVPVDNQCTALVILDGSLSYDDNGDSLEYFWFYNGQLFGEGVEVEAELGSGEFAFALIVNDGTEDSLPDEVIVTVIDDISPEFRVRMDRGILWPANNKMVKVTPSFEAIDNCGGEVSIELVGITCNQKSPNDIEVTDEGIFLRANRDANDKDGRVYTISYKATDESGNENTASAEVKVPHDLGR